MCTGAPFQAQGTAWADTEFDPAGKVLAVVCRRPRGLDELDNVGLDGVVQMQVQAGGAHGHDRRLVDSCRRNRRRSFAIRRPTQSQNFALGPGVGVTHLHVHQKAIELGFRESIGPFLFNRVLCGHDQEQVGEGVGGLPHGHLALSHGLQQR